MSNLSSIQEIFGSESRYWILKILSSEDKLNKSQIHSRLEEKKIDIAFKNVHWVLDRLNEEGLISFSKGERNSVICKLDRAALKKKIGEVKQLVEEFKL